MQVDNYILKEGDTLGCTDGRRPVVIRRIGKTHVTYVVRGQKKERRGSRDQFHYMLRFGGFFLLERAS